MLIEEPFDLTNTARSVFDQRVFSQIKNVFKRSAEVLGGFKNVEILFEKKFSNFSNLNGRFADDDYDWYFAIMYALIQKQKKMKIC